MLLRVLEVVTTYILPGTMPLNSGSNHKIYPHCDFSVHLKKLKCITEILQVYRTYKLSL